MTEPAVVNIIPRIDVSVEYLKDRSKLKESPSKIGKASASASVEPLNQISPPTGFKVMVFTGTVSEIDVPGLTTAVKTFTIAALPDAVISN